MNKISNQKGLRQRSFEIIRKPDLENSSFLFNNVRVAYVATNPENGISFYANNGQGGVVGVRVHPDGRKVLTNATCETTPNGKYNAKRKQRYLQFKNAFGYHKNFLASHAVYIAWSKQDPQTEGPNMPVQHLYEKIPAGMTIDHIDGCTTNNFIGNLRCISLAINSRDGGFLRKLRNKGIKPGTSSRQTGWRSQLTFGLERQEQRGASLQPDMASAEKGTRIPRWILLRYFDRMAHIKANISSHRYRHLTRADLMTILFYDLPVVYAHFEKQYHLTLPFKLGLL